MIDLKVTTMGAKGNTAEQFGRSHQGNLGKVSSLVTITEPISPSASLSISSPRSAIRHGIKGSAFYRVPECRSS
jgi:hypothetical protein